MPSFKWYRYKMIMMNQMSIEIQHRFCNLTITKHSGREQYEVHKMLLKYVNIHLKTIELLKITQQKERYNAKVSLHVVCMSENSHI